VTLPAPARVARLVAVTALLALPLAAAAQPGGKVARVGFILTGASEEVEHLARAFDDGLRALGWVQGQNVVVERRFAAGDPERLPGLAAELIRLNVDVIVTGSNPVVAAVKQRTATIPIVMALSRDPVGSGFVASLSRPGGNVTGLTNDPSPEMLGKHVELLKEVVPKASRIAVLWSPGSPGADTYRRSVETAARKLAVTAQPVEVRRSDDIEGAFAAMMRQRPDALLVVPDPVTFTERQHIARLAVAHRLPAVYFPREHVDAGGLMSYGSNLAYQFRRAAVYVDRILKGAKPGDLAVEQPAKFELVINLRAAKAIGVTIPLSLRLRADEVIE
jgi:putative ABC transport system substrate-binding protein